MKSNVIQIQFGPPIRSRGNARPDKCDKSQQKVPYVRGLGRIWETGCVKFWQKNVQKT